MKVVLALNCFKRLIETVHIVKGADLFCHPTITDFSEVASRHCRLRVHRAPHRLDDNRLTKVLDVRVEFVGRMCVGGAVDGSDESPPLLSLARARVIIIIRRMEYGGWSIADLIPHGIVYGIIHGIGYGIGHGTSDVLIEARR